MGDETCLRTGGNNGFFYFVRGVLLMEDEGVAILPPTFRCTRTTREERCSALLTGPEADEGVTSPIRPLLQSLVNARCLEAACLRCMRIVHAQEAHANTKPINPTTPHNGPKTAILWDVSNGSLCDVSSIIERGDTALNGKEAGGATGGGKAGATGGGKAGGGENGSSTTERTMISLLCTFSRLVLNMAANALPRINARTFALLVRTMLY